MVGFVNFNCLYQEIVLHKNTLFKFPKLNKMVLDPKKKWEVSPTYLNKYSHSRLLLHLLKVNISYFLVCFRVRILLRL